MLDNATYSGTLICMTNTLLVIDPQNDFCDSSGALAVPGASEDCIRLADLIRRTSDRLQTIHVTLDTHHLFHIAHPIFWQNSSGAHPEPFTIITSQSISAGQWRATVPQYQNYAVDYVHTLEKTGKYNLCIWPPHCRMGTWGHQVYPVLQDALTEWERLVPGRIVDYTTKGSNVRTEHYSAIRAEVSDAADPGSRTNFALIERLKAADNIAIAGEALSHCVANTVRDLITCIPAEKLIVLTDVSSNVPGFEHLGSEFLEEVKKGGVRLMSSTEFLAG